MGAYGLGLGAWLHGGGDRPGAGRFIEHRTTAGTLSGGREVVFWQIRVGWVVVDHEQEP